MSGTQGSGGVDVARKGRLRRVRKLAQLARVRAYRDALRLGVAAAIEHEDVAFDRSFRTVIDVGAHHGQFALLALRRFPDATVYCVEPLPEARDRLARVVAGNPRVRILPFAAAERSGTASYHVSRATDSSSLLPITDLYTTAFPGTDEVAIRQTQTARLDDLVPPGDVAGPCLMKIDVQGGELEALAGAEGLLDAVDDILVECSFVEFYAGQPLIDHVIDHLHTRGFRLTGVYSVVRDAQQRCLQADLLFTRNR